MTKPTFDMDAAIASLKAGKGLTGKDGILTPLIKQLTEAAMQTVRFDWVSEEFGRWQRLQINLGLPLLCPQLPALQQCRGFF